MNKPRVIKDFNKVPIEVISEIKEKFPYGFDKHLITFSGPKGKIISAFPYETEDRYYLIRMTKAEANEIHQEEVMDLEIEEIEPIPQTAKSK